MQQVLECAMPELHLALIPNTHCRGFTVGGGSS